MSLLSLLHVSYLCVCVCVFVRTHPIVVFAGVPVELMKSHLCVQFICVCLKNKPKSKPVCSFSLKAQKAHHTLTRDTSARCVFISWSLTDTICRIPL